MQHHFAKPLGEERNHFGGSMREVQRGNKGANKEYFGKTPNTFGDLSLLTESHKCLINLALHFKLCVDTRRAAE